MVLQSAFGFLALIGIAWLFSVVAGTLATLMSGAVVGMLCASDA